MLTDDLNPLQSVLFVLRTHLQLSQYSKELVEFRTTHTQQWQFVTRIQHKLIGNCKCGVKKRVKVGKNPKQTTSSKIHPKTAEMRLRRQSIFSDCKSKLEIDIRFRDWQTKPCKSWPTKVHLIWTHNHPLKSTKNQSLRPEAMAKFLRLFAQGHNPASALRQYLNDPDLDKMGDIEDILRDRSIVPDYQLVARLYNRRDSFEGLDVPQQIKCLGEKYHKNYQQFGETSQTSDEQSEISGMTDAYWNKGQTSKDPSQENQLNSEDLTQQNLDDISQENNPNPEDLFLETHISNEESSHEKDQNIELTYQKGPTQNDSLQRKSILCPPNLLKETSVQHLIHENDRLTQENKHLRGKLTQVSQQLALVLKEKEKLFKKLTTTLEKTKHMLLPEDLEDIAVEDLTHVEDIQDIQEVEDMELEVWSDGHFINISDPQAQMNSSQAQPSTTVEQSQACTSQLKTCASITPSNLTDIKIDTTSNHFSGQLENGSFEPSNDRKSENSLDSHNEISKTNFKFFCGICKEGFVTKVALVHHSSRHKIETVVCQFCGVKINKARIYDHIRRCHSEKMFNCTECGAKFYSKARLNRHKYIHSNAKPFMCEMCGAGFVERYLLRDHCKKCHGIQN